MGAQVVRPTFLSFTGINPLPSVRLAPFSPPPPTLWWPATSKSRCGTSPRPSALCSGPPSTLTTTRSSCRSPSLSGTRSPKSCCTTGRPTRCAVQGPSRAHPPTTSSPLTHPPTPPNLQVLGLTNYSHWGDAAEMRRCMEVRASSMRAEGGSLLGWCVNKLRGTLPRPPFACSMMIMRAHTCWRLLRGGWRTSFTWAPPTSKAGLFQGRWKPSAWVSWMGAWMPDVHV
jgi:hypothetical protein